jgi:hypothetical protein
MPEIALAIRRERSLCLKLMSVSVAPGLLLTGHPEILFHKEQFLDCGLLARICHSKSSNRTTN